MITFKDIINNLDASIKELDALNDKDPDVYVRKKILTITKIYLLQLNRKIAKEEYYAEWIPMNSKKNSRLVCSICGAPESGELDGHCIICDAIMRRNKNENS